MANYRYSGIAQWLDRLAQDRKVLGSSRSHAERPLLVKLPT